MVSVHLLTNSHTIFSSKSSDFERGILFSHCKFCVSYAAVDDTQRMMQMGGFGFDASKVLLYLYTKRLLDQASYISSSHNFKDLLESSSPNILFSWSKPDFVLQIVLRA